MEIIRSAAEMRSRAKYFKRSGRRIGFVPTMGALHEGHLSLMRLARTRSGVLVTSVFVNPSQFGSNEDLEAYPRDFARDEALCRKERVDVLFAPGPEDVYASDHSTWVEETSLSAGLCGAARPGHFRGVCTVVAKLFNLVRPDVAVFGEKDAQQLRVVERMVRDLGFPVQILRGPIVREPDGLAMSSRNRLLSPRERRDALCLRRALTRAEALTADGERSAAVLREAMEGEIRSVSGASIDYVALVDDVSLKPVERVEGPTLAALAVRFGATRLIDNVVLEA